MRGRFLAPLALLAVGTIAALVGTVLPATICAAAPPSIGIQLLRDSSRPPTNPLASSYIVERLAPARVLVRRVLIDNATPSPVRISVYVAGAKVVGRQFLFFAGRQPNELSRWAHVSESTLHLASNAKAVVALTIDVPRDATSGQHYAVLWAALSAAAPSSGHLQLVSRVGVRMYISVGPGGTRPSTFSINSLRARRGAGGDSYIEANVHNRGGNTLALSGTLTMSHGPEGLRAGPFTASMGTVLPAGLSEPVTIHLGGGFPRGPWRVRLTVRSGTLERSVSATVTFPPRSPRPPGAAGRFGLLLGLVLLLMGVLVATWVRRRSTKWRRSNQT